MSILWNVPEAELKSKLLGRTAMINWGSYRANFFCKLCLALYVIMCCPSSAIMYKDDGTERNKDNLMGHVIEYKLDGSQSQAFKKCVIGGKEIDIGYFGAYERNKKVARLVFSYNQSVGKNADTLKICTNEAFNDLNTFISIWESTKYKQILTAELGEDNINFTPLNHRITAYGHDRAAVKFYLYPFTQSNRYTL